MFGSEYLLSPVGRLLWALRTACANAEGRDGVLAEAARAVREVDAVRIPPLAELPLLRLAVAVLGNLVRFDGRTPDWVIGTILCGVADALGLELPGSRVSLASPEGRLYRQDPTHGMVAEEVASGAIRPLLAPGPSGLILVGDSEFVRILVGAERPTPVAPDPTVWRPQLEAGLAYVEQVSPGQAQRLLDQVSLVASFDEPPGLMQSLSADVLPGFIVLRANNGPAEVGDQLVHETAHQLLDEYLAGQPEFVEELRQAPSAYSPFFHQPRPAIKLLHGVVSYLEVLRFWQAVVDQDAYGAHLEEAVARKRLAHVQRRCEGGLRALRASTSRDTWARWSQHLEVLCPAFRPLWAHLETERPVATSKSLTPRLDSLGWLNPIERAELLLALDGQKLSRLSVSLDHGAELARALDPLLSPLFSRQVFLTRAEQLKGRFSNLPEATFEYSKPPPGATVFAYVARDTDALVAAVRDDEENRAGAALGIPACCQAHFASHWQDAIERFEGDLLAWTMDAGAGGHGVPFDLGMHPPETNAFALVLGRGLTWHFPCSLDCEATVESIRLRRRALEQLDAGLAATLWAGHGAAVVWTPDRAFLAAPISWSGGAPSVNTREARCPEWTPALRVLAERGPLVYRDGEWRDGTGQRVESLLPHGSHLVLFDMPFVEEPRS